MDQRFLGKYGEAAAAEYLRQSGYQVEAVNYRCRFGEIDIIAKDRKYIAFIEVKLRKNDHFAQAKENVTFSKQKKLILTAQLWLQNHTTHLQPRFDVIEVYYSGPDASVKINHLINAFEVRS